MRPRQTDTGAGGTSPGVGSFPASTSPLPEPSESILSTSRFHTWMAAHRAEQTQDVQRIPFSDLFGWDFVPGSGDLAHESGRFFRIEGVRVEDDGGPVRTWTQPIIRQPEIGILGIAVHEVGGTTRCLMQAKAEPGNVNGVQLAPTVQATHSNYTRVHGGSPVPYLDLFQDPPEDRVVADSLQSEPGTWFDRKRNRHMIVRVGPEVEALPGFCWLTVEQLQELIAVDHLLNMTTRTVMSCLPHEWGTAPPEDVDRVHRWLVRRRCERDLRTRYVPLSEMEGWRRSADAISHDTGAYFSVVAVSVRSASREVPGWSQPLIQGHGLGVAALFTRRIDGVPHALMHARAEPGFLTGAELGPTVQCEPGAQELLPPEHRSPFLHAVLNASSDRVRFDTELSEEGGRFLNTHTRYVIVDADGDVREWERPGYRWVSVREIAALMREGFRVNMQARTLVAAWRGRW